MYRKLGASLAAQQHGVDLDQVKDLAQLSWFNRLEGTLTPGPQGDPEEDYQKGKPIVDREIASLKSKFKTDPVWFGSVPMGINAPGDVDIDIFTPIADPKEFQKAVETLRSDPDYEYSQMNAPEGAMQVFKRKARDENDYPVDVALVLGDKAVQHGQKLQANISAVRNLDPEVRKSLVKKKVLLKNTPLASRPRYYGWKNELAQATGTYSSRNQFDKEARVLNLQDPSDRKEFESFTKRKDVYGHSSHHAGSILESGKLMSAMEALKRGKLKSYEAGSSVGTHKEVAGDPVLSKADLNTLHSNMLRDMPNETVISKMADRLGVDDEAVKRSYLKQGYNRINRFLKENRKPETFREKYFSVSKLGPNIFLTKGGIMDEPAYGDTSFLVRTHSAKPSKYLNLLTNEHTVGVRRGLDTRAVNVRSGIILAPADKIDEYEAKHPEYRFVNRDALAPEDKEKILVSTRSAGEITRRIVPHLFKGELKLTQTK